MLRTNVATRSDRRRSVGTSGPPCRGAGGGGIMGEMPQNAATALAAAAFITAAVDEGCVAGNTADCCGCVDG